RELSKEEEADEDELESEEEMLLAQSLRLGQHSSSHASRTTEEHPGDEHGGEQTDGSKEEKNSGVAPPPPQQQQDAEGNNAGGDGDGDSDDDSDDDDPHTEPLPPWAWYYLAPRDIYCDAEAAEQAVKQAGSGFVKLKSNNGVALWFTMPNGDVYRDPLRAEAAVSEAGFRNLKVTRGLGDAGMVYLRDRTKREQEKQERSRSRREKTARRAASMSTSLASRFQILYDINSHIPRIFFTNSPRKEEIKFGHYRSGKRRKGRVVGLNCGGVAPHHPMQANVYQPVAV
ncbi:hypothetical protein B0H17DRAFT_1142698, partial [Mycena rosella]